MVSPFKVRGFFGSLGKFDCFLHYFSLKSCMCMSMQKKLQTRTYQVHMIYITYLPHVTRDTIIDGLTGWKSTAWKKKYKLNLYYTVYLVTYCRISVCIFIYLAILHYLNIHYRYKFSFDIYLIRRRAHLVFWQW